MATIRRSREVVCGSHLSFQRRGSEPQRFSFSMSAHGGGAIKTALRGFGVLGAICALVIASSSHAVNIRIEPCDGASVSGSFVLHGEWNCDTGTHVGTATVVDGSDVSISTSYSGAASSVLITISGSSTQSIGDLTINATTSAGVSVSIWGASSS